MFSQLATNFSSSVNMFRMKASARNARRSRDGETLPDAVLHSGELTAYGIIVQRFSIGTETAPDESEYCVEEVYHFDVGC
jgi:hypothetical protein